MPVEADLRLVPDLLDERGHPFLRVAEHQRAGRVHDVDALRAAVDHDPRLLRQPFRADPVREHQEADGLHAHVAGGGEVLQGDVRLGAMRRDPRHRSTRIPRHPQVLYSAEAGQQQHRDLGLPRLVHRGGDQLDVVHGGEAVVERRAAKAVAVGDLDDLHARAVQAVHDAAHLLLGEAVRHRVAAVAKGGVGEPDLRRPGTADSRSDPRQTQRPGQQRRSCSCPPQG